VGYQTFARTYYPADQPLEVTGTRALCVQSIYLLIYVCDCWLEFQSQHISTSLAVKFFKHGIYSPSFSLQNAVCFVILMYLVPVLFTFFIQGVLKLKKIIPALNG